MNTLTRSIRGNSRLNLDKVLNMAIVSNIPLEGLLLEVIVEQTAYSNTVEKSRPIRIE